MRQAGFTLVEVLVAMTLIACAAIGVAELLAVTLAATQSARVQTSALVLASQKMEQLRAVAWGDADLSPSPGAALSNNTNGYVDYLDLRGRLIGSGGAAPAGAVYIRRWAIASLAADPSNALVLQVLVTTRTRDAEARAGGGVRQRIRLRDEALLTSVRTRTVPS
jgi:prepilin-type N-terminal cleavage/methylation domain-containing protein